MDLVTAFERVGGAGGEVRPEGAWARLRLTLPCRGDPGCYAWLSGEVLSVGLGWPVTVTDQPGPLVRSRCGTGVARPSDP
ncbi:MAG: hypothetical protein QOH50_3523 [Kribbellaceae bacterium]|jgi:hypothetical protein|nr:hypothetical protein [Kribbellaceae bacterium]